MSIIAIPIVGGFVITVLSHMFFMYTSTQFGSVGRRNMYTKVIFSIIEAILLFPMAWLFKVTDTGGIWAPVFMIILALLFIFSSFCILKGLGNESPETLIEETLWDVTVVPAGYRNRDREVRGITENGKKRGFILRGADKALAKHIKENGIKRVTVTWHPSSHRVEKLTLG